MLRKLIGATVGVTAIPLIVPVAFADEDKYKSIYDEEVKPNLPGTTRLPKPAKNALTELESKIDDSLRPKKIEVDGKSVIYNQQLKSAVKSARETAEEWYEQAYGYSQQAATKLFRGERSVTNTLSSLRSPDEQLLPASVYILVAALSGSVLARPRNVLVRTVTPIVFGVGAFAYFLPKTYQNTNNWVYKLEKENVPQLADAQDVAAAQYEQAKKETLSAVDKGESSLKRYVKSTRAAVEKYTGLDFSGKANSK